MHDTESHPSPIRHEDSVVTNDVKKSNGKVKPTQSRQKKTKLATTRHSAEGRESREETEP